MAKSTKHQDKVGTLENFRAPWETESGEEVDVNKATLKRLLFNLKLGEAKALDAVDDVKVELEKAEKDLEQAQDEAADANGAEAQKKIDRLQKKVDELTAEKEAREAADEHEALRKDVLGDLDPKYAKYVQGETREELEESLEAVKADFGLDDESGDDDDDDDDDEPQVRTTPRRLVNAADVKSGKPGEQEYDFDAIADGVVGNSIFH